MTEFPDKKAGGPVANVGNVSFDIREPSFRSRPNLVTVTTGFCTLLCPVPGENNLSVVDPGKRCTAPQSASSKGT